MKKTTYNLALAASLIALTVVGVPAQAQETAPWPADVPGFVAPAPGEHPRLLFRRSDLPALRKKARTPEGKAILRRLRHLLGNNGEAFPDKFSPATKGYPGPGRYRNLVIKEPGYFTISHAAGYGLLYQLTGEQKYADLGREAFEKMMAGTRDIDSRYSFVGPNGELRSGSSWAIAALGYDLCYDGWDEAFRGKVAKAFLSVQIEQKKADLRKVVTNPKYRPSKNHYGGIMCGAAAAAAIMADPGTEGVDIAGQWLPAAYKNTKAMLTRGFGDHGFYAEGHGPSHVSSDTGLLVWLQAAKVACGKDFITPRPNAQWITLRWVMEIVPIKGLPQYPDRKGASRSYGTDHLWRGGPWSHSGQFAQGFGVVDPEYVPAVLWTYRNFVEAAELKGNFSRHDKWILQSGWLKQGQKSYDAIIAPWHAVVSFVNWPVGVEAKNPATVLPKAMEDRVHGYYVFRNRWKDGDDILVTALLGYGPRDAYKPKYGRIYLWGLGKMHTFGNFRSDKPADFRRGPDGGVVSTDSASLAVDFSGKSGAPLLLALIGIDGPKAGGNLSVSTVKAGGQEVTLVTLQEGKAPEVKAEGDKVVVGKQTVTLDGNRIILGQ